MFLEARPIQRVQRVCRRLRVQSHPILCDSTLIVLFQVAVRHACCVHGLQRTISSITYSQNLIGLLFVDLRRHCHSISLEEVVAAETSNVKTTRTLGLREKEVVRNVFDSTLIISRTTVPQYLLTGSGQASWTVGANPTLPLGQWRAGRMGRCGYGAKDSGQGSRRMYEYRPECDRVI